MAAGDPEKVLIRGLQWLVGQELARARGPRPSRAESLGAAAQVLGFSGQDGEFGLRRAAIEVAGTLPSFNQTIALVLLGGYDFPGREPPPSRIGEKRKWLARQLDLPPRDHDPKEFRDRYEAPTLELLATKLLMGRRTTEAGDDPGRSGLVPPTYHLPVQLTSFVGRARELEALCRLAAEHRLITLVGPGGSGKTRLALEVAARLGAGLDEGAGFVDLASLSDPDLVASQVAVVLGIGEQAGRPLLESLVDAIGDRRLLVVLDNCEQVIDGAAKLADRLLRSCSGLQLLATSREAFAIDGEQVYPVLPLALPSVDDAPNSLGSFDAVRLFVERARAQRLTLCFEPTALASVADICRRLDGIPLAIELAAARVRSLSLEDLCARLDDRFRLLVASSRSALPRQQTLRATVDWSYDLLHEAERLLLARLSVFCGSFGLEAAEAVGAADDLMTPEVDALLTSLCDQSLVVVDDTGAVSSRYRMLETIRHYAAERLDARGADEAAATRDRHATHFLALAERAAPELIGADQKRWADRLELEFDNVTAAMAHLAATARADELARMVVALRWFWLHRRSHAAEASQLIRRATEMRAAVSSPTLRARFVLCAAHFLIRYGDTREAAELVTEGMAAMEATDDPGLRADLHRALGWTRYRQGRHDEAAELLDRAYELALESSDPFVIAQVASSRAASTGSQADFDLALRCFRQAQDVAGVAIVVNGLGNRELHAGNPEAARAYLEEGRKLFAELENEAGLEVALCNLLLAHYLEGDYQTALHVAREVLALARRSASYHLPYVLLGVALCASAVGETEAAARLHGAADSVMEATGSVYEPGEADLRAQDHALLAQVMGDREFRAAYDAGRMMPRSDSLELARRIGRE